MPSVFRWLRRKPPLSKPKRTVHRLDFTLNKESWKALQQSNEMPSLLAQRQRALTLPCSPETGPGTNVELGTYPQTQSVFFTKLPLELRQLVYEELFGKCMLHLEFDYAGPEYEGQAEEWRWWHCLCHTSSERISWDDCRRSEYENCQINGKKSHYKLDVSMLSSCRQA
jgi:hypothetical protein